MESVEFTCTENDFLQAQRLHQTLYLRGRRFALWMGPATLVMIAFIWSTAFASGYAHPMESGLLFGVMYLVLMALLIAANRFVALPRTSRRQFLQLKEFQAPLEFEVSPPVIGVTTKNGFAKVPTEDFLKWAENNKVVLIYRSDRMFHVIPQRAVTEAFHTSLMAELARANVSRARFSNS
jgi:hypothetical protein